MVEDLADGLAVGERSYSFAEAVRRKPLEESASGWTASVVSWESTKSVSSFEFLSSFLSPGRWESSGGDCVVLGDNNP